MIPALADGSVTTTGHHTCRDSEGLDRDRMATAGRKPVAISDAPLELSEGKRTADRGMLLVANHHLDDRVELVVRSARERDSGLT